MDVAEKLTATLKSLIHKHNSGYYSNSELFLGLDNFDRDVSKARHELEHHYAKLKQNDYKTINLIRELSNNYREFVKLPPALFEPIPRRRQRDD